MRPPAASHSQSTKTARIPPKAGPLADVLGGVWMAELQARNLARRLNEIAEVLEHPPAASQAPTLRESLLPDFRELVMLVQAGVAANDQDPFDRVALLAVTNRLARRLGLEL